MFADLLEAGGGVLELVQHGPLNCGHVEIGVVCKGLLVSILGPSVLLISRLIEVGVWNQDQTLD